MAFRIRTGQPPLPNFYINLDVVADIYDMNQPKPISVGLDIQILLPFIQI